MKKVICSEQAPAAIGPYSHAIQSGDFLFISGQLPVDAATQTMPDDISAQTRQSLDNVKSIILSAGFRMEDIVKTTVFVKDLGQFNEINQVYAEFFSYNPPARACFEVARLPKDAGVEIEAIAHREKK